MLPPHPQLPGILMGPSVYSLLLRRQAERVAVSLGQAGAQPDVCMLSVHPSSEFSWLPEGGLIMWYRGI